MVRISNFIKEHPLLCIGTLGLAIIGCLGYNTVCWIVKKCQKTEKIDQAAKKIFTAEENSAATQIQSAYRSYKAQKNLKELKYEKNKAQIAERKLVTKSHLTLSKHLLKAVKPFIYDPSLREDLPRAKSGRTAVYLPKDLPFVLKLCGENSQSRFDNMVEAQDICVTSGYKHLIIPKARVCGEFIVESRLPITEHNTKEQIGLYIANKSHFSNVVKEFTGFLCQSTLNDIVGTSQDPYQKLTGTLVGRYDNVPLYMEQNQGKIGLIDLEQFKAVANTDISDWCYNRCYSAVSLFPYHLEEIIEVAKAFDSEIEVRRKDLEEIRDEKLELFKIIYEDHLEFLAKKNITVDKPTELIELSEDREEELKEKIKTVLTEENSGSGFKGLLNDDPVTTLSQFNDEGFSILINAFNEMIKSYINANLQSRQCPLTSNEQLLSARTFTIITDFPIYQKYLLEASKAFTMMKFDGYINGKCLAQKILHTILTELAGKEIAYYNTKFGFGGYARQCIFC